MFQSIQIFLRRRGFLIVMIGFCLSFSFMAMYLGCIYGHASVRLRTFAFYATFVGIGVFAVGRIGVFLENRARRKNASRPYHESKDSA